MQQAPDGFRGTYNEVLAHEQKLGLSTGSEHELMNLYEAPDGFRGSYDEVLAHEQKHGLTSKSVLMVLTSHDKLGEHDEQARFFTRRFPRYI